MSSKKRKSHPQTARCVEDLQAVPTPKRGNRQDMVYDDASVASMVDKILVAVARGGGEDPEQLYRDYGEYPVFPMTAEPLYSTYTQSFVRAVVGTCLRVLNGEVERNSVMLGNRVLCLRWRRRISTWIRRFFVDNAVPSSPELPSPPASLYHAYLYLRQIEQGQTTSISDLQQWVREGNVGQLSRNFPTLRDFYATTRTFASMSTCSRWRCQYKGRHKHQASQAGSGNDALGVPHAGVGFEHHFKSWVAYHERLQTLAQQLYIQPTVPQQLADPWVDEARAKSVRSGTSQPMQSLLDTGETSERLKVQHDKDHRLDWMGSTSRAVGGNLSDTAPKTNTVDLSATEEDERQAALSFGTTTDAKLLGVLMTSTRFFYWGHSNISMVQTRTCVAVDQLALGRATTHVRAHLDRIMHIEPGSDVGVSFTKMIYQTSMVCCVREDYLRRFTTQNRDTNPITIMNRSLSPENIFDMQKTYTNKTLRSMYADSNHEYKDILDLCLMANEMTIWTRIAWLDRFCMFGNGFQDHVNDAFLSTLAGRPRRPLVALVAGQWAVVEGVHTLYLCRTSLEAVVLWMLLMWVRYDSQTEDRMCITGFLKQAFEVDQDALEPVWLTERRRKKWKDRVDPDSASVEWRRLPDGVQHVSV
jgi:hypothetical protein